MENTISKKLLSQFDCPICFDTMIDPITTICGHNFCKYCLYSCQMSNCPVCRCPIDSFDYQINTGLKSIIEYVKSMDQNILDSNLNSSKNETNKSKYKVPEEFLQGQTDLISKFNSLKRFKKRSTYDQRVCEESNGYCYNESMNNNLSQFNNTVYQNNISSFDFNLSEQNNILSQNNQNNGFDDLSKIEYFLESCEKIYKS